MSCIKWIYRSTSNRVQYLYSVTLHRCETQTRSAEPSLMMSASAQQEVFILLNIQQAPDSQLIVQTWPYQVRNITRPAPPPPPPAKRTHINSLSPFSLSDSLLHLRGGNHFAESQIIPAAHARYVTCGFVKIFGLLIKQVFFCFLSFHIQNMSTDINCCGEFLSIRKAGESTQT